MAPSVRPDNLRSQREALTMVLTARLRPPGAMAGLGFMVAFTAAINNSTQPTQAEPQVVHKYMSSSTQCRAAGMTGLLGHSTSRAFDAGAALNRCTHYFHHYFRFMCEGKLSNIDTENILQDSCKIYEELLILLAVKSSCAVCSHHHSPLPPLSSTAAADLSPPLVSFPCVFR
ncbi:hypothetical protein E2C01_023807 [Portunus trituberculatus]|uniref:Uncharacterized protein n=1 Tax=Portunus trituberculatus TaxID=210409 RepID=A0A5B7E8X4_PORTR|nr:hypothetical protein [Portunus trituberculatus]